MSARWLLLAVVLALIGAGLAATRDQAGQIGPCRLYGPGYARGLDGRLFFVLFVADCRAD